MSKLPPHLQAKAKDEIREDETRKQQSLKQFREWIAKHPFIKKCRMDDIYLLPFLRARKYSMDRVFESFEKALIFVRCHENWFNFTSTSLQRTLDLYDYGYLKVMKHCDSQGHRIIVGNNRLDMDLFNADDVFRLHCMIILLLSLDEETQFNGAIYIDDFTSGITMKYFTMFPLKSIYDFTLQLKVTPIRLKNIFVVGLPSFAGQFLNILKMGLSSVMHDRFQVHDKMSDLWSIIDQSVMTTEYGGETSDREAIDAFRELIDRNLPILRDFFSFELDMTKIHAAKCNHEIVGSFRKLEID